MKPVEQKKVIMPEQLPDSLLPLAQFIERDRPLAPISTFQTGGAAAYFMEITSEDQLCQALKVAHSSRIPFFILGGGSNLLISDKGFDGLVLRVKITGLELIDKTSIRCGAGEELMALVRFAAEHSLSGLEFASGIFGWVGGAIFGNAGAYGGEIKDVLSEITLVETDGTLKKVPPSYCQFAYRESLLKKTKEIVTRAVFTLTPGDKKHILDRVDEILKIRAGKHPVTGRTAGSFFKNIPDPTQPYGKLPAGKLLEEIGAKGMRVGGAAVYEKHANMIINTGTATSKDIRQLADILKEKVRKRFAIELEEEVIQVGDF